MTPKNRKFLKKKRSNKCHKNANSSVDIKMPRVQRNRLSLIERMAFRLKEDSSGKLVTILEGIFSIFKVAPKKKPARLELINSLLSNVKEYETKDINGLRDQLNTVFFPKELKQLMVDPSDLLEVYSPFFLLWLGVFQDDAYLTKKDGSEIRVEIKRARDVTDEQALIREAKTLSQLRHENIIKILAFDKAGCRFATERMTLGNLEDALKRYHFTCRKMFEALKGVASAMAYLADRGYVLRNLRSENVLLDGEGVCKIGDFRRCRYVGDEPDGTYVEEDATLATEFSAPEVRREGRFSAKSDVWDFALLACEVFNVNPDKAWYLVSPENIRRVYLDMFLSVEPFPMPLECPFPLWTYLETELIEEDPKKRPTFAEILRELKEYDDWDIDP